jgi:hypothetical protein
LVVSCLIGIPSIHAKPMLGGIAMVTSETGNIQITEAGEKPSSLSLHEALQLNGSKITTGAGAHLFLALSNGVGVGVGESTEVIFETFEQRPYPPEKEGLAHEPSVSKLSIRLIHGTAAISSNNLSPLSEMRILMPTGQIRIHSSRCVIQHDEIGLHIATYFGNLTYYYPDSDKREFITTPQSIRISKQSAALSRIAETKTAAEMPAAWEAMAAAARHASQRVFFKSGGQDAVARPVLIVSPEYFKQASPRPYELSQ